MSAISQEDQDERSILLAAQDDFYLRYEQWDREHSKMKERPPKLAKNYVKHARNLLPLLENLAELHPVAKAVVFSFRAVIDFQYDRIENDVRVYNVFLTASDMMRGVLEIDILVRKRNDREIIDSNRHLQERLRVIASDIKECGNAIDTYYKESKLVKFLKAKEWKETVAEFNQTFTNHRIALTQALSLRTARGVDDLNTKMDSLLASIFAQTEAERKLQQQIRVYGTTTDKWIQDPDKLQKLYQIFPDDPMVDIELFYKDEKHGGQGEDNDTRYRLMSHMASLKEEVGVDVKTLCARNKDVFMKKLDFQTAQIQEAISCSTMYIVGQLSGPYDRLKHDDLRKLWKEMNWIFCVDGKEFSMALYEYYLDYYSAPATRLDEDGVDARYQDKWTLDYLSVFGEEICKAVDTDGSGYIRISEVNAFTDQIPLGWTFPQWCVYQALGWHYEQHIYQKRLQHLLDVFHEAQAFVTPWNRWCLQFFISDSLGFIHNLSRGPRIREYYNLPPSMQELIRRKVETEVEQYRGHFKTFRGHFDSEDTVKIVYKNRPLETYILQLCVFILERCLDVAHVCRTKTVDLRQWIQLDDTIDTVKLMMTGRMGFWEASFRDKRQNIEAGIDGLYGGLYRICYLENIWKTEDAPPPVKWGDVETKLRREDFILLSDIPWPGPHQGDPTDILNFPTWEDLHSEADPEVQPPIAWPESEEEGRLYAEMASFREHNAAGVFPFHDVECNNCEKWPFVGHNCYSCLDCDDFDLCLDCFRLPFEDLKATTVEETNHLQSHRFAQQALYTDGSYDRWVKKLGQFVHKDAFEQFHYDPQLDSPVATDTAAEDDIGAYQDGAEGAQSDPPIVVGWNVTCNACKANVQSGRYFVRCLHRLCDDFDLCQTCAEKNDFHGDPHSEEDYLEDDSPDATSDMCHSDEEGTEAGGEETAETEGEPDVDIVIEDSSDNEGAEEDEESDQGENKDEVLSAVSGTHPPDSVVSPQQEEVAEDNHRRWHTMVVIPISVTVSGDGHQPSNAGGLEGQSANAHKGVPTEKDRIAKLEDRIEGIEKNVSQLKELLLELLDRMK